MVRFFPYVVKGLWRHRLRSLLTVSGATVALFVLCLVGAVREGMRALTSASNAERTLIVFQENRFCPSTSRLPDDYARTIRDIPGVVSVMPIQVVTNNCRASLDIVIFHGVRPDQLPSERKLELVEGSWTEFSSRADAALVGANVARRRNLRVGEPFSVGEITVHVAGIFRAQNPADENLTYTNLAFLQRAAGPKGPGQVTQFEVRVADDADADRVAAAIDQRLHTGAVATSTRRLSAFAASTLGDLVDLVSFSHWLGYAAVGLVLTIVAATTLMSAQDRAQEHALLEVLGLRPGGVFRLIVAESMLLCLLGGFCGTLGGILLLTFAGLGIGAEGVSIAFRPSWSLALTGGAVSLAVGFCAGFSPAWNAARANLVRALRSV